MAIVTPDWEYIYWYSGTDGMKPTDELFHLAKDRGEMENLADNPEYADKLAAMKKSFDAELVTMESKVINGHQYEAFPKLLASNIPWDQKQSLAKPYDGKTKKGPGKSNKKRKSK